MLLLFQSTNTASTTTTSCHSLELPRPPPPSPEQELVLKAVKQGRNAQVNAVAGSGKTTTILRVAQAFSNWKILGTTFGDVADDSVIV
jgi:superfamily II DNA or RNA helicase